MCVASSPRWCGSGLPKKTGHHVLHLWRAIVLHDDQRQKERSRNCGEGCYASSGSRTRANCLEGNYPTVGPRMLDEKIHVYKVYLVRKD